jgi:hypothetical protein
MAGSYNHVVNDDGTLKSNEALVNSLETGGDVYEAIEEMYGMIWWLANKLDESLPSMFGPHDTPFIVEQARLMHHEGLEISAANRKGHSDR